MIQNFLDDIDKAIDSKAYLSALALALSLPDICGKIQFGKEYKKHERYIKWFNQWIYCYFEIPKSNNEQFNDMDELLKFDGQVCYALRSEYLHAGNIDINKYINRFELCVCDSVYQYGDGHGIYWSDGTITETHRRINVITLLKYFILGTKEFLKEYNDDSSKFGTIEIINFKNI